MASTWMRSRRSRVRGKCLLASGNHQFPRRLCHSLLPEVRIENHDSFPMSLASMASLTWIRTEGCQFAHIVPALWMRSTYLRDACFGQKDSIVVGWGGDGSSRQDAHRFLCLDGYPWSILVSVTASTSEESRTCISVLEASSDGRGYPIAQGGIRFGTQGAHARRMPDR